MNPIFIWVVKVVFFLGSPRVDGDDEEDDVDDIENEFNYAQGNSKARRQWQGEDADLSSSSRREPQQPIPLLTNGQPVSIENHIQCLFSLCNMSNDVHICRMLC